MATDQTPRARFNAAEIRDVIAIKEVAPEIDVDVGAVAGAYADTDAEMKVETADRRSQWRAGKGAMKKEDQDSDVEKEAEVEAEDKRDTGADQALSRLNSVTEPSLAPAPEAGSDDGNHIEDSNDDIDTWDTDTDPSSLQSSPEPLNSELRRISYATPLQVQCRCLGWCTCPMHASHPESILSRKLSSDVAEQQQHQGLIRRTTSKTFPSIRTGS